MIQKVFIAISILAFVACHHRIPPVATTFNNKEVTQDNETILVGHCSLSMLQKENYKYWYNASFNNYKIDSATANHLKPLLQSKTMEIFLGSWCDDSRREVPRMIKILKYAGIDTNCIKLIFLNHAKQSPQHEEVGKNITNVPTFILYNNAKEIGRIIESPKLSLEEDLLSILLHSEKYTAPII